MNERRGSAPGARNPWLPWPSKPAGLRLFCFPYAGGGASVYRAWIEALAPELDVCPVQLPGREERLREPPFTRVDELVAPLAQALGPALDRPFAFFGHSMGAVVAYETARHLEAAGGRVPVHLIVSGCLPPARICQARPIWNLPREQLLSEVRRLGGTPAEVLEDVELMDLLAPLLRADLRLHDAYQPRPGTPLHCPVTAFWGRGDLMTAGVPVEEWRGVTSGAFEAFGFEGGHFFLRDEKREVTARIRAVLARHLGAGGEVARQGGQAETGTAGALETHG